MEQAMDPLFNPRSVAVVGVSESKDNLGRNIIKNLVNFGYQGKIYPVGPRSGEVEGLSILSSIAEISDAVDVAVILTPARFVPEIVAQCGGRGVRWAVIQTGGFRESGPDGMELEKRLVDAANRHGVRFVGPNCLGVMDTSTGFSVPFIVLPTVYRTGNVAVMAQSGGMGLSLAERLDTSGVGFGKFVSLGNKLNLDELHYLKYLMGDPKTEVIYFYLEDFKRGREFIRLAAESSKPIIVHKSNTSSISRTIAQSHTAALATDDRLVDHLTRAANIIRVHSVSEAIQAAKAFSMPRLEGKNLAVISRSGGHAVVAADACGEFGFRFPPLRREVLQEIRRHGRAGVIQLGNPLDLGDIYNLNVYFGIVEQVLEQADIDGIVHVHVSHMAEEQDATRRVLGELGRLAHQYRKPIAVVLEIPFDQRTMIEKNADYPFFFDVREAVQALAIQHEHRSKRRKESLSVVEEGDKPVWVSAAAAWLKSHQKSKRQPMVHDSLKLLEILQIPTAPWKHATSLAAAREAAEEMGYPVVLKAVGGSLIHKSDRGGVIVNVEDPTALKNAWGELISSFDDLEGIIVQKMIFGRREMIVGANRDATFGPVVLAGFGGILVEVLKDVSMRLAPVDRKGALEMIRDLSCAVLLKSYRGLKPADTAMVADALVRISQLIDRFPEIREVEINPILLCDQDGTGVALDARVLLEMKHNGDSVL